MIQRRIVVLLLTIFLAIPSVLTTAQTPVQPGADDRVGIQASVLRTYGHPNAEVGQWLTSAAMATLTLRTIDITATSFDTVEHASAWLEQESAIPFEPYPGQNTVAVDETGLEGMGPTPCSANESPPATREPRPWRPCSSSMKPWSSPSRYAGRPPMMPVTRHQRRFPFPT